jgi:hypothetical protein
MHNWRAAASEREAEPRIIHSNAKHWNERTNPCTPLKKGGWGDLKREHLLSSDRLQHKDI